MLSDCPFIVKIYDSNSVPFTINPRGLLAAANHLSWFLLDVKKLRLDPQNISLFIAGISYLYCLVTFHPTYPTEYQTIYSWMHI